MSGVRRKRKVHAQGLTLVFIRRKLKDKIEVVQFPTETCIGHRTLSVSMGLK